MKTTSTCIPIAFSILVAIMLFLTGCANIPPEVKMLAVNVRTNVAELHTVHAKDVRALAIVVNQREMALREADCALRHAFQKMLEAEITASKTKALAQFDLLACEVLGAGFQVRLQKEVYPKFAELERTNLHAVVEAYQKEISNPDSPGVCARSQAAQRDLDNVRCARDNEVSYEFLALSYALKRERFNFETKMGQAYRKLETNLVCVVSATNSADQALADLNKRVDDTLELLDKSYNQLDQTLSDLSTDLDSGAVSKRFVTSFFTGVGSALVSDLKSGQLGAAAVSQLLNSQAPGLVRQLNGIESKMVTLAGQSVTNAVNSVPTATPKPSQ